MDRAAIFAEVTRRNALRRAHGLPLLDVRAEYAREVSLAEWRKYHAHCNDHAADYEAIRRQVLAELRTKHGTGFRNTMGGRWAVAHETRKRFVAFMELVLGSVPPPGQPAHCRITYGGDLTDGP